MCSQSTAPVRLFDERSPYAGSGLSRVNVSKFWKVLVILSDCHAGHDSSIIIIFNKKQVVLPAVDIILVQVHDVLVPGRNVSIPVFRPYLGKQEVSNPDFGIAVIRQFLNGKIHSITLNHFIININQK